ncbi:hypothetical protein K435DRAFT_784941 [Dendrothele bispora CBS 962.96]|uniref:Uncharacterized protein n=1 Tax=Dendrothele bispora (strain CBS 962.96) TaxID=1314807 RepID=A0A4S8KZU8_DENBC|nr:hypothetical protein K435DRAFT_784941 [Dendrothele bispora CBS 962.96]
MPGFLTRYAIVLYFTIIPLFSLGERIVRWSIVRHSLLGEESFLCNILGLMLAFARVLVSGIMSISPISPIPPSADSYLLVSYT